MIMMFRVVMRMVHCSHFHSDRDSRSFTDLSLAGGVDDHRFANISSLRYICFGKLFFCIHAKQCQCRTNSRPHAGSRLLQL